ncbi:hypothetical protein A3L09_00080 [Thermococcus profundus]|uniref:Transporter n=1 Tax=Thermococcus profundus TaxID=49899 RepID=A0A2Z2M655_THEPR|nr:sodium-dependent transporter [Thermococcus profundus]ASJ01770.1 hypothetical protein A3L09_00080 [Thermococcus profundus]
MSRRLGFPYLTLVVAAFMVGLGNVWKFPAMVIKYGLGGLAVYLASVVVLTGILAVAVETTKRKRYELVEYFDREYGKPSFALLFLIFDVLLLGYYSIVGGWTLSSIILGGIPRGMLWNMGMGLAFLIFLLLILVGGTRWIADFMVASFVLFFVAMSAVVWGMYHNVGQAALADTLSGILVWKGVTLRMALEMASQAAYSLGVGMGFYLVLGAILPRNVSGTRIVAAGAFLDTLMALGGLVLVVAMITIEPSSTTSGSVLLFEDLPLAIRENLGPSMLYAFNFSLFLAAMTSMVPIGEVTGRIIGELMRLPRGYGVFVSLSLAASISIIVSLLSWLGLNPVGLLDGAVSAFILFGGIIEAYAAVKMKDYIPGWLKAWAWMGIPLAGILGLYALVSWCSPGSQVILAVTVLVALGLNEKLKKRLEEMRRRIPGGYYR